ncbi:MAG: UvrD-helicase domain-containing protein [Leptospiraceae bacterium]|nr:UvrD-helicase domain-containing protein [Leptospiraceae bacterium]
MSAILENLNPSQKKAVLHKDGPLLILAGAGSGKTRVITHRIANLILSHNIHPYRICAVTFTNKAAAEMKDRIKKLLPNTGNLVMVKTFHSLCLYILRKHPKEIGLKSGFSVYDSSLSESLLKEIIKDLGLEIKAFKPSHVNNIIQKAKDAFETPEEFASEGHRDIYYKTISQIYKIYEDRKTERNALDFGDLILKTVLLFKGKPEILTNYNTNWEYIMVDEYQDTNRSQYELTKLLAGPRKNICVVGDDDQSIYSWRGADIRNILDFEKDYPETLEVKLEENYRSTANIIEAASSVIENNNGRKNKKIFTNNETGEAIPLISSPSEYEESEIIIKKIKDFYRIEKKYSPFAIFYRTNAQSRFFEEALRKSNIPYKIFGGFRFYDRAEIKDMIAYLSVIVNPSDTSNLLRIINFPTRGIGETSIEKLRSFSVQNHKSMYEVLEEEVGLKKKTKKSVDEFKSNLDDLRKMYLDNKSPSSIAKSLIVQMGIDEEFKKNGDIESLDRLENIEQFVEAIQEYEESEENPSLEEYLNQISLLTSEEEKSELLDFVTLMTIHNSKGLEFDYVFLSGMEDGTFPHFMNLESEDGLEEERRLCYVAITRARKRLFISFSQVTRKFGEVNYREPSRFLEEIPENLLIPIRGDQIFESIPKKSPKAGNRTANAELDAKKRTSTSKGNFSVGSKVKHKDYGIGKILQISGNGDNVKVKIQFGYTEKNFLLSYTPLELVE